MAMLLLGIGDDKDDSRVEETLGLLRDREMSVRVNKELRERETRTYQGQRNRVRRGEGGEGREAGEAEGVEAVAGGVSELMVYRG